MILLFMYKWKHPRIFLKWLFTREGNLHQLCSKLKSVRTILFQSLFLKKHNAIICDILHCNHPYIFLSLCEGQIDLLWVLLSNPLYYQAHDHFGQFMVLLYITISLYMYSKGCHSNLLFRFNFLLSSIQFFLTFDMLIMSRPYKLKWWYIGELIIPILSKRKF